ncbi:Two-component transcriptional response regulator, AtoC family [uncultured Gammaproteobacteria bacterium]|nr:Two-component transcriptional response regulator, AtoC family [uncultured Gammaproteobacteria bacterium]
MKQKNILIVDDEAKMRRILEIMLQQMEFNVFQAEDGLKALQVTQDEQIDLIITDLQMPNLDGLGLLKQLRAKSNTVPVIMVTAHGTVETAVTAMQYGASDYILRPFELEAVEAAVQRALKLAKIEQENSYLRSELDSGWGEFIGNSSAMQSIYTLIQQVSATKTSVLIQGETGTGKELVARAIHRASPRRDKLFVAINCAAIPADILESELFGYQKGAFTGAHKDKVGKFELAEGGTLFLDEITEMDFNLQAKLLRVLQERRLERLGSNTSIAIDIRIIAASNRDPKQAIATQKLREDLYYRLNVFTIELPNLHAREQDIIILAEHFLQKHAQEFGFPYSGISTDAKQFLLHYAWPGNVRELENMMERAIVLSGGRLIETSHLPFNIQQEKAALVASDKQTENLTDSAQDLNAHVEQLERRLIKQALDKTQNNKAKAAQQLNISERSLWYKIKKYALS